MDRKRRHLIVADAEEDAPPPPAKRRKLGARRLPFLAWDCWGVVLSYLPSWTQILAWDTAFMNRSFHAQAFVEVEGRIAGFIGNGKPVDRICVGKSTLMGGGPKCEKCHHTRGRNACRAVYYVPRFYGRELSRLGVERCSVTGGVVRPTIVETREPVRTPMGYIAEYVSRRRPCVDNPEWLRDVQTIPVKMRGGVEAETPWEILTKRVLPAARKQLCEHWPVIDRSARNMRERRDKRDACIAMQRAESWFARMEIDIHDF